MQPAPDPPKGLKRCEHLLVPATLRAFALQVSKPSRRRGPDHARSPPYAGGSGGTAMSCESQAHMVTDDRDERGSAGCCILPRPSHAITAAATGEHRPRATLDHRQMQPDSGDPTMSG